MEAVRCMQVEGEEWCGAAITVLLGEMDAGGGEEDKVAADGLMQVER